MNVIICGGGHVGTSIAQYLEGEYEVTLIDTSQAVLSEVSGKMDVQTVLGNAADPDTLERAGARSAGILIAVTGLDEVNVVTCQMAHSIFDVRLRIARLRNPHYTQATWAGDFRDSYMPIDVVISPEEEVAAAITRHLQVPFAFEVLSLADDKLQVLGLKVPPKSPLFFTPIRHFDKLFPDLKIVVLRILRGKEILVPTDRDELLPGDSIYVLLLKAESYRFIEAIGYQEEQSHRLLILGGGRIGLRLAEEIERVYPLISCTLIEYEKFQTRYLVSQLNNTLVLQGDALDTQILQEAGIDSVDTVVAVTNDDKVNILGALLAKRSGARRAVTLVNRRSYVSLISSLGIDKILSPSTLTISLILQRVRKGHVQMVHSLGERVGEILEIDVQATAYAVGLSIGEMNIRKELWIVAVMRAGQILFPPQEFVIQAQDHAIVTISRDGYRRLRRFFDPRFEGPTQEEDVDNN
jgi:trk system potassium uptake protein TrkA